MEGYVVLFVRVEPLVLRTEEGVVVSRWKATSEDLPGWSAFYICKSETEAFEKAKNEACLARSDWKRMCAEMESHREREMLEYEFVQEERKKKP